MIELDPIPASAPAAPLRTAAFQVARFRGALDWMLAHPLWEGAFALAVHQLGFKGQRQGIGLRKALLCLPLEHKFAAARHALEAGLEAPSLSEARRLARHWGVTAFNARSDRLRPSAQQWTALTRQMKLRLSARYESYKEAQMTLYAAHQGLVTACAYPICRDPSQREDACQEGRLALLEAIDHIEVDQAFEAYARQWIKRRIQNFILLEKLPVKAPVNLISRTLLEARRLDTSQNERQPSPLANALREGSLNLDASCGGDCERSPSLRTDPEGGPDSLAARSDEAERLQSALQTLTTKQRQVLALRFGFGSAQGPKSLAEIARLTGITRQQVFQREKRALRQLARQLGPAQLERAAH